MRAPARGSRLPRPSTWLLAGIGLCLVLRAPWLGAALGRDEGGLAFVADSWNSSGPFAYGDYFVDRPPLLLGLFRLADGALGVRLLGAVCAAATVVLAVAIARRLGGREAVPGAALVSALLVSSVALGSVFTPAELIAGVPGSASILLLVVAIERDRGGARLFAAAGALAVVALLVKQSAGGALLAGCAALAALALLRRPVMVRALAYAAGAFAWVAALELWETLSGTADGSISYAILGFRLDALSAMGDADLAAKLERLPLPAVGSGLLLALVLSAMALRRLRGRTLVRVVLGAWLLGSLAGVAAGGSYWAHYLIALAPVCAVGTGIVLARMPQWRRRAMVAFAVPAIGVSIVAVATGQPGRYQRDAVTVGKYLRERARPGDTAYVLYARANVLFYSGLRSPFPYNWSLMVRAAPDARERLRAMLASPDRPTWLVKWQAARAYGLDPDGTVGRSIERHYRQRAIVCGRAVYLARGLSRPRRASLDFGRDACDAGLTSE